MRRLALSAVLALAACATAPRPPPAPATPVEPAQQEQPQQQPQPPPLRPEKEAYGLFAEGVAAYEAGNLTAAEDRFLQVLEQAPRSANTRFNVALLLERQGRTAEALEAYEGIRRLHPGHVPTLLSLGRLYQRQGRLEEVLALYEAALQVPGLGGEPSLLLSLASALREQGRLEQAEATVRRVLSRHPEERRAHAELALVAYAQGRYRLAELVCTQALQEYGEDPGLHNTLALVAARQGDRVRALAELRRALELEEGYLPAHLNLGALALGWGDWSGAERALARAVELAPDSPEAWLAYARALDLQKGREPRKGLAAGEAFEKVLALREGHTEALCGAGWAFAAERTGWDKAVEYLHRCRQLDSTPPQERQRIEARLQGLEALRRTSSQPEQPEQEEQQGAPEPAPESPQGSLLPTLGRFPLPLGEG